MRKTDLSQLVVRADPTLMARIDRYAERLRTVEPGPAWTRSDAVRKLLALALETVEADKPKARKK